jgi:hypothetical protein
MGKMDKEQIFKKVEKFLESPGVLSFDIGEGHEIVTFLAGLAWEDIEALLSKVDLSSEERKMLFENIEETKGRMPDEELPESERARRIEERGRHK